MLRGDLADVLREESEGSSGVYVLRHPLGLRALPRLADARLDPESVIRAEVSALHLLESRRQVEWLRQLEGGPRLVVALRGPLSFSERELARLTPRVAPAQVEAAVSLLLLWARETPERVTPSFEGTFVGLTPWTAVADVREHLDGLRRHDLVVDPLRPVALDASPEVATRARDERLTGPFDPAAHPFDDARMGPLLAAVRGETPRTRIDELERALVAIGLPPKPRGKRLRLLQAAPEKAAPRGNTREVDLTRDCNFACGFCTARGAEARSPRERAARAIAAVRAASRDGGTTLVLGGAEPTLEWYLEDLVILARDLGFEQVILETNAALLAEPGRAAALALAGVTLARVALNSFDEDVADAISGSRGALAQTIQGVRALLDAGIPVELAVALLPENRGSLERVVDAAAARLPPSRAKVEGVVARVIHRGPDGRPKLPLADAANELLLGARASQRGGVPLVSAPGGELPPCVFDAVGEVAPVLRLSEGIVKSASAAELYARIPLCDGCGAAEVCPGPRRGLEGEVAAIGQRVRADAPGLPPSGERKRVLRELLSVVPSSRSDGTPDEQRVLRVNFHCNQACDFCFVSRELPVPDEALVLDEIARAAERGAALALSGGEPTLNPRLLAYVARATELGIDRLELQTNAVKMSDAAYATALAAAGLKTAFVSLHGTTAATSDRVTRAPGTFVKTILGIKNLLVAGVLVRLNFVLCVQNAAEFAEWPDFVARELAGHGPGEVQINFSFVAAMTHNVPRDTALLPRFSDVAWALEAALGRADALGMTLHGFDSQCGVPACFLPRRIRETFFTHDLPGTTLDDFSTAFRKGDACATCAVTARCYGVRAAYAEMYGTSELHALAPLS